MKQVRCKGRKTKDKCVLDGKCNWNGTSCEHGHYDTYLNICKTKKGKDLLIDFAKKLDIDHKATIPILCQLIADKINQLKVSDKDDAEKIFNDLLNATYEPVPIITQPEIRQLERERGSSDSEVLKKILEFPMNDRLRFDKHVNSFIGTKKDTEICAEINSKKIDLYKRIGTPSVNGEAYLTKIKYRGHDMIIATKLMLNKRDNQKEIDLYKLFSQQVRTNVNPHYPIMYNNALCMQCPFQQSFLMNRDNGKGLVVLNELANGDLKTWLMTYKYKYNEFASMMCQIMMAGFGLENEKLVHHDLHWGNVLYHNTPQNLNKYYHYQIKSDDIYLLNSGHHWVLWDFGMTEPVDSKKPYDRSYYIDAYRISHIDIWLKGERKNIRKKERDICRAINARSLYATSYLDLIHTLHATLDTDQKILLINPVDKPTEIINKTVYKVTV